MRASTRLTAAAALAILATPVAGSPLWQTPHPSFQQIAPDVYVWQRPEPSGLAVYANNLFIVRATDVVVVDTDMRMSVTREVIGELRRLTPKPVSHVINTHWHDDHFLGNVAYREAFPDVKFVGHRTTAEDLEKLGGPNRKSMIDNVPPMLDSLRKALASNQNLAGQGLTAEARIAHEADLAWGDTYIKEVPGTPIVPPTLLVDDRLVLDDGKPRIEMLHAGHAHTRADLIVHLPAEGIVATGDVVMHPVPLLGNANFNGWITALDRITSLKPRLLVPGHGPVMRDLTHVTLMRDFLSDVRSRVAAEAARGASLADTRKAVDLSLWRTKFAGDSAHQQFIFGFYTAGPGVAAAYEAATKK